ncbi:MAG: L-threonylcarbamoyladenylate synthase [Cyanobacteria bacterium J06621_3]
MTQVSLSEMVNALGAKPTLVAFPTDTVPALAARPEQAALIFEAKQRPPEKPLILMGASLDDLLPFISGSAAELAVWRTCVETHWPGQLTLVLPESDRTPQNLNPTRTGTLGIRVPNHPIALQLLAQTGPLATTSANFSGQPPLTTAKEISRTFPAALTLADHCYVPGTSSDKALSQFHSQPSGLPSTVAKWTGTDWEILRQGKIHL